MTEKIPTEKEYPYARAITTQKWRAPISYPMQMALHHRRLIVHIAPFPWRKWYLSGGLSEPRPERLHSGFICLRTPNCSVSSKSSLSAKGTHVSLNGQISSWRLRFTVDWLTAYENRVEGALCVASPRPRRWSCTFFPEEVWSEGLAVYPHIRRVSRLSTL